MICYYDLGPDKTLNSIVMAGSHDAGVTAGGSNTKTQEQDILGQACSGVRIFDIRITGAVVKKGSDKNVVALKAYHGKGPSSKKDAVDLRTNQDDRMKVKSMWAGEYGMTLTKILTDAAKFVTQNTSEFLILKFDKCHNWPQIAEACVQVLGTTIYTGGGNLNTKTLRQLQGKVIVTFTKDGIEAVGGTYGPAQGILGIKNLSKGGSYDNSYEGLQYFGSGGTQALAFWRTRSQKIAENIEKQTKLMAKGGQGNPNVMGMMYWTTTGITDSIRDRNNAMWAQPSVERLRRMWHQGLEHAIQSRINVYTNINGFAGGQRLKAFMPNFVMIDFADDQKCQEIYELNTVPVTFLVGALGDRRAA